MSILALKQYMSQSGAAALITSEESLMYLTGFHTDNGYLLVTGTAALFFTDSRYIEAAEKSITCCDECINFESVSKTLAPVMKNLGVRKIALEADRVSVLRFKEYERLFDFAQLEADGELDGFIEELRLVKSESEREKIKRAQQIAEAAFENVIKTIRPGVTEREIMLRLNNAMLLGGAQALSFDTIVVSGENGSKPHGVPTDKAVRRGEFITMDFGAMVDGYHGDMTRTVAVGEISGEMARVYETVLSAQLAGLKAVRAGVLCSDADAAARSVIERAGYGEYFSHSLGHGVGVEIHEQPSLFPSSNDVLRLGSVVTVEPGIYFPGRFGVRIEDTVLVTEHGCENFNKTDKKLIIL